MKGLFFEKRGRSLKSVIDNGIGLIRSWLKLAIEE